MIRAPDLAHRPPARACHATLPTFGASGLRTLCVAAFLLLQLPRVLLASPQWNAALATGGCLVRRQGSTTRLRWCNTLSTQLLVGRQRDRDVGAGPYVRATVPWGAEVTLSAGASLLLPLSPTYPLVISTGGVAGLSRGRWGVESWLFWGPSSYNFHSSYSMASGLLVGAQQTFGAARETVVLGAVQIDLEWLSLPALALYEAAKGPSP